MAYGTVKVDNVTFTYNAADATTTFSGFYASTTNNLTLSGTASANTFTGTTANFTNANAQNISVTTLLSGLAITGGTAGFTTVTGTTVTGATANFVTVSGTTVTGTTARFTSITGGTAGFTTVTGTTVTGTTANFVTVSGTSITGGTAGFTTVTGTTVTGTTANFVTLSGTTVTGNIGQFTSLTGATTTMTSGVFALGTAPLPSISFVSDPNTGIYSPGADQLAVATNGVERVKFGTTATEVVFNDGGVDYDFRVESDLESQLFSIDASDNSIGLGTSGNYGDGVLLAAALARATGAGTTNVRLGISVVELTSGLGRGLWFGARTDENTGVIGTRTASGNLAFETYNGSWGERMRLTYDGRLGIGTSSPGYKLDVTGPGTANGVTLNLSDVASVADSRHIQLTRSTSTAFLGIAGTATNDPFFISRSGTNSDFIISSTGKVGIGTTGPAGELDVRGSNSGNLYVGRTNNSGSASEPGSLNLSGPNASGSARIWGRIVSIIDTATEGSEAANLAFQVQKAGGLSEVARLDGSGRLLVGTSTAGSVLTKTIELAGAGTGTSQPSYQIYSYPGAFAADIGYFSFNKSRGSSVGTNTIVASGDSLGMIQWKGANGTGYDTAASIYAEVDGTPGASSDMPGRLVFSTTADSGSSPTERMRIKADGDVSIVTGNLIIGTAGKGIDFSADGQAAGMTSELLDDYEVGTWTPTFNFGGTSGSGTGVTYGTQSGRYTKIGRSVVCTGEVVLTNKGSSSGVFRITGWPFTNGASRAAITYGNVILMSSTGFIQGYMEANQTYTNGASTSVVGTQSYLTETDFSNTTHLQFTVTFQV